MYINVIPALDKPHLLWTFVQEGKIRPNKIVYAFEFLNSGEFDHHCLELSVINYLELCFEFLEVLLEKLLEFSSGFPVAQVLESDSLHFDLKFWGLGVALLMESSELGAWVLGLFDGFLNQFHAFHLTCATHVVPVVAVDYLEILALVFNVFFSLRRPLDFLRKAIGLVRVSLLNNDLDNVLADEDLVSDHRDKLYWQLLFHVQVYCGNYPLDYLE